MSETTLQTRVEKLRKKLERLCRHVQHEFDPFRARRLLGKLFYRYFTVPKSATQLVCMLCRQVIDLKTPPLSITHVYLTCYRHMAEAHPDLVVQILRSDIDSLINFALSTQKTSYTQLTSFN